MDRKKGKKGAGVYETSADQDRKADEALRTGGRSRRPGPGDKGGRNLRLPRAERRREDDHHQDTGRIVGAYFRQGLYLRLQYSPGTGQGQDAGGLRARPAQTLRQADGTGVSLLHRGSLRSE